MAPQLKLACVNNINKNAAAKKAMLAITPGTWKRPVTELGLALALAQLNS